LDPSITAVTGLINLQVAQGRMDAARESIRSLAAAGGSLPVIAAQ